MVAAIQVASALASLMHGSSGLGERLQAMQLTLDAILNNQIRTFEAISAVNDNLEFLKRQIPELFKEDAYRRSLVSSKQTYDGVRSFAKQIFSVPPGKSLDERDFAAYREAYNQVDRATSELSATVSEKISGVPGLAAMSFAGCSIRMLAEQCWLLAKIERKLPAKAKAPSWNAKIAFSETINRLKDEICTPLINNTIPSLLKEQSDERDKTTTNIRDNPWGPPILKRLEKEDKTGRSYEYCLRSGYAQQDVITGTHCWQMLSTRFNMDAPETCTDLHSHYSLTSFQRRLFDLDIVTIEATGDKYAKSASFDKVTNGWYVPENERSQLANTPHARGQYNPPPEGIKACFETKNWSDAFLQQMLAQLTPELERHAQAQLYIASLTSLKSCVADSQSAIQLLQTNFLQSPRANRT